MCLLSVSDGSTYAKLYVSILPTGLPSVYWSVPGGTGTSTSASVTVTVGQLTPVTTSTLGAWNHIAVTVDPSTGVTTLFWNGQSVGSNTAGPGPPALLAATLVATNMSTANLAGPTAQTASNCGVAIAAMADVQFYSTALSPASVGVLAGLPGTCASPAPRPPPSPPPPPSLPTAPAAPPAPASLAFGGAFNTTCPSSLVHRVAVLRGQSLSVADTAGTWTPGLNGSAALDSTSASVSLPGTSPSDALLLNGNAGSSAIATGAAGVTVTAVLRLNATAPLEKGVLLWSFSDATGNAFAALWAVNAPGNASKFNLYTLWRSSPGAGAVAQTSAVGGAAATVAWHRVSVSASALGAP